MRFKILIFLLLISGFSFAQNFENLDERKKVKNFSLPEISGENVQLKVVNKKGPVILIFLRGWPEYQCPICSRQVGKFIMEADKIKKFNTSVIFVYPGPSNNIKEKAEEFAEDFELPSNFYFALDSDFSVINKYGIRWDAKRETVYPSTFIINKKGKIIFSKISQTHGGRANVDEVLEILEN